MPIRSLGVGGFAEVTLARDLLTNRDVVLKRPLEITAETSAQLVREFSLVAPLDHPGVARAVDLVIEPHDGGPAIIFEAIDGVASDQACRTANMERALSWALSICESLVVLHANELIHGDIKPENILIRPNDAPTLIDFGLARRPDAIGGGTASTAAPESLRGESAGVSADLFSLGATLYYWLFKQYPFGESLQDRVQALDRQPSIPASATISGGLSRLLRALLAPDRAERPASALEAAEQLASLGAKLADPMFSSPEARARALPLIGREDVLAELAEATDRVAASRFVALFGARGCGATRVISEVARRARLAGRRVVEIDSEPGLNIATALLSSATASSLAASLAALREAGPTTVFIDNAYRLDERQQSDLAAIPTQLGEKGDLAVVVGGIAEPLGPGWVDLQLAPLSQQQVAVLTRSLLPSPPLLPETARRLWKGSGGQPGQLVRLLVAAVQQGLVTNRRSAGWDLYELGKQPLPVIDESVDSRRTVALTDRAAKILDILVLAADELALPEVAQIAGLDWDAAASGTRELVATGFVRREGDGLVANRIAASQWTLNQPDSAISARILVSVGRRGSTVEGETRARWLSRLARYADAAGRPKLACRLTQRAIGVALQAGRPDIAAGLLSESGRWMAMLEPVRASMLAGEIALSQGRPEIAEPHFAEAAGHWESTGLTDRASHAFARQARALCDAGRLEEAKASSIRALGLATSVTSRAEALLEQSVVAARMYSYAETLERSDQVLGLVEPSSPLYRRALGNRARSLSLLWRLREADIAFEEASRSAQQAGDVHLAAAVELARVQATYRAGDHERVLEDARHARQLLLTRGEASGLLLLTTLTSSSALALENLPLALEEAEDSLRWRTVLSNSNYLASGLITVARTAHILGDSRRARGLIQRVLDLPAANRNDLELIDALRTGAQIAIALGEANDLEAAAPHRFPPPPDSAPLEQRALAAVLDGWRAVARQDRAGAVAALRPFGETLGTQPRLNWFAGEGLALLAWGLALEEPASALSWARTARELADQIGDVDASVFATRAEAEALETQGDRVGAQDLRAALRSRLRDLASRAAGPTFAAAFLARPDRAAFLSEDPLSADNRRLNALYEIVADLNSARSSSIVIGTLLDRALQVVGGERGAVILIGPGGDLEVVQRRDVEEETERDAVRLSKSVLARAHEGEAVLAVDPANDPRFKSANSVAIFAIRAVLCVPLRHKAKVVGALYIDSRDPKRRFNRDDLAFVQALAHHAALALENARAFDRLQAENERLRADLGRRDRLGELIGRSPIMETLFQEIEAAARSDLSVLIGGETGTGKDLVARQIHRLGMTPDGPFVALNCAALPESIIESQLFGHEKGAFTGADRSQSGLIVQAQGGTLFLDEVAELPLAVQAKLLRVLEERVVRPVGSSREIHVQFRLISASHTDLEDAVRAQRFRADLLYRIVVLRLRVPALRERPEDIPLLVRHLLDRLADQFGQLAIKPGLLERLARWSWPGNVRELENVLSRLAVRADSGTIDVETLESDPELRDQFGGAPQGGLLVNNLKDTQRDLIRRALEICDGNRERAAQMLGMSRATLFRKIKEYGLEAAGRRARLRPPGQPPEVSQ